MQSLTGQTLKIFWQHSKKYPWQIAAIIFGLAGHIALQNYTPLLYKKLVDAISQGRPESIEPVIRIV